VTISEPITAECAWSFMFVFPVHKSQVGYSIIPDLLEQGVGVGEEVCKMFGCNLVDHNCNGFNVYTVSCKWKVRACLG
jgi:hypothetical protein